MLNYISYNVVVVICEDSVRMNIILQTKRKQNTKHSWQFVNIISVKCGNSNGYGLLSRCLMKKS